MTPDTLRAAALARLRTDTTFQTLTGATGADDRLYYLYSGDAILDSSRPAYVTYSILGVPETSNGVLEPTLGFTVWGTEATYDRVSSTAARLKALFDKVTWGGSANAPITSRVVREADTADPKTGFIGEVIHVRLGVLQP